MDAITLQDVGYAREGRAVLSGISLDLSEGRIGVIGMNGAGKTQLLRLIAGLAAPDAGRVRLGAIDPARDRAAAIARIGILFQNPDHQIIFPTVDEEVAFGLTEAGAAPDEAAAQVAATLARFGRADWAGRHVQTLSQGQRHLLCLMAVLAMEPQTILLDEPFSALDLATTLHLRAILDQLPHRVIQVTHDLVALGHYERVIWLDAGGIAADGSPGAVLPAYRAAMEERARDVRLGL